MSSSSPAICVRPNCGLAQMKGITYCCRICSKVNGKHGTLCVSHVQEYDTTICARPNCGLVNLKDLTHCCRMCLKKEGTHGPLCISNKK